MGLLARFRHDHVVTGHHDHIVLIQQMVTNHHPLQHAPIETRLAKSLYRPVPTTWASPARNAPHRHASGHRHHRCRSPTELAQCGRIETLAYTSENGDNIRHGRWLLVYVELGWGIHI